MAALLLAVDPRDRLFASADPMWRAAKRRLGPLLVAVLLFHAALIAILVLMDQPGANNLRATEIPVEIIVQPPPPPQPPAQKPKQPKPSPMKQRYVIEDKPALDAPRTPNEEKIKRENNDKLTRAPVQSKPVPADQPKPTPDLPKPAQNAASQTAQQTTSPQQPQDEADAEPLDKAAQTHDKKSQQQTRKTKHVAMLPDDQREAVARELASLTPSPNFSIASESKLSPVGGGTADMRYMTVLYGLIVKQEKRQPTPRSVSSLHNEVRVIVGFWIDDSGALIQQALERTSGYPDIDAVAMSAVRRAAPFPTPPYGEPHAFYFEMGVQPP